MAKAKFQGESTSGYFRQVFESNLDLLDHGKNDVILGQWQADHPGQTLTDNIKASLSNTKSILRKKYGKVKRRRRKHGKTGATDGMPQVRKVRTSVAALEKMEALIDECLSVARRQETSDLDASIKYLLSARRAVAWQMGQPN
jgi:hypothetical protein